MNLTVNSFKFGQKLFAGQPKPTNPFLTCLKPNYSNTFKILCFLARVQDAYWNLRRIVKMSEKKKDQTVDKSKDAETNGVTGPPDKTGRVENSGDSPDSYLFDRVSFQKDNIVLDWSIPGNEVYDTILW